MKHISILLSAAPVLIPMMQINPLGAMLFIALFRICLLAPKP